MPFLIGLACGLVLVMSWLDSVGTVFQMFEGSSPTADAESNCAQLDRWLLPSPLLMPLNCILEPAEVRRSYRTNKSAGRPSHFKYETTCIQVLDNRLRCATTAEILNAYTEKKKDFSHLPSYYLE